MSRKHGFNKAACKRLAAELRGEIGLEPLQPLDPWQLADLYGIQVMALSVLPVEDRVRDYFTVHHQDVFSGALVPMGSGALIIENDSHPEVRRRSTMSHEIAHVVGEHQFGTSLVNERGCRVADPVQENEAAEIAGELLIPFEAARILARRNASDQDVARQFGVSLDMAKWRMNATGARLIAQRGKAAYRSKART